MPVSLESLLITSFYVQLLRKYLDAESRNKRNKPFDFTGWVDYSSDVRFFLTPL